MLHLRHNCGIIALAEIRPRKDFGVHVTHNGFSSDPLRGMVAIYK